MSALTPEQRAADRALVDKATPGPWHARMHPVSGTRIETLSERCDEGGEPWAGTGVGGFDREEDAALIARAREGWPAYMDALDEAEREIISLRAELVRRR